MGLIRFKTLKRMMILGIILISSSGIRHVKDMLINLSLRTTKRIIYQPCHSLHQKPPRPIQKQQIKIGYVLLVYISTMLPLIRTFVICAVEQEV